jgi:hypothetical protein
MLALWSMTKLLTKLALRKSFVKNTKLAENGGICGQLKISVLLRESASKKVYPTLADSAVSACSAVKNFVKSAQGSKNKSVNFVNFFYSLWHNDLGDFRAFLKSDFSTKARKFAPFIGEHLFFSSYGLNHQGRLGLLTSEYRVASHEYPLS